MSILKQMQKGATEVQEETSKKSHEELIKEAFMEKAHEFWGKISKLQVVGHKESQGGTPYYLLVCENDRNGSQGKLIQEWYISKEGLARINPKRTMWIDISLADEIAGMLFE